MSKSIKFFNVESLRGYYSFYYMFLDQTSRIRLLISYNNLSYKLGILDVYEVYEVIPRYNVIKQESIRNRVPDVEIIKECKLENLDENDRRLPTTNNYQNKNFQIPQWLIKVKYEKAPRVFVMIPAEKNSAAWTLDKSLCVIGITSFRAQRISRYTSQFASSREHSQRDGSPRLQPSNSENVNYQKKSITYSSG
ncbi:hypothetical protein RCL_jg27139.t1 [Rhizophagus clarus]|uniref:Uncharacterized protein n=1 Tax=Rhizophagus clarus TaxID=94130 RepID=A0A8H3M9R0_9GLOM|nr:hypothetical protein RCL_jg27139.t1 [Rhizophagus clarus]